MKAWIDANHRGPVALQPGKSGQFDVVVDGRMVYSRYQTGRFPTEAQLQNLQW